MKELITAEYANQLTQTARTNATKDFADRYKAYLDDLNKMIEQAAKRGESYVVCKTTLDGIKGFPEKDIDSFIRYLTTPPFSYRVGLVSPGPMGPRGVRSYHISWENL